MTKMIKVLGIVFCMAFLSSRSEAKKEHWVITTLEWPPYICFHCPENGAGAKALREALQTVDVEVEFVFSTWTKAIANSKNGEPVGYFPAWFESIRPEFIRSAALWESPVGFVELKKKPLHWKKLTDLKGKLIGVVTDYRYTGEFLDVVKDGTIRTESVISDDTNIRKVAAGNLDGAIIDVNNALYFLNTSLADLADQVQVNRKYIKMKSLHLAFLATHKNNEKKLNEALKKVRTEKIVRAYLEKNYPFSDVSSESSVK